MEQVICAYKPELADVLQLTQTGDTRCLSATMLQKRLDKVEREKQRLIATLADTRNLLEQERANHANFRDGAGEREEALKKENTTLTEQLEDSADLVKVRLQAAIGGVAALTSSRCRKSERTDSRKW